MTSNASPRRLITRPPRHWADLDAAGRRDAIKQVGLPPFRADQVSRHYFERCETDPGLWSDLPATGRASIKGFFPLLLTQLRRGIGDHGLTAKSLYRLHDNVLVEAVLMRYPKSVPNPDSDEPIDQARSTLCLSTQAGCGIGCPFCATGQAGLTRNLSAAEMVEQVRLAKMDLKAGGLEGGSGGLNNLVLMGMGEPLANYQSVMTAIAAITDASPNGFGLSARGVTVSTSGLVPRIADLAGEGRPLTLAVSLHAPDDALRDELVPLNRRFPVASLLDAARDYFEATGRRVSIEYALMRDINDQVGRAVELARQLNRRGRGWVHVNLIPLNPTPGSVWTASRHRDQQAFITALEQARVPVTLRHTRGADIDGACGQLAARYRRDGAAPS
ncbi:MAG: radical SAM protein [Propionibacteriaceae bacterium]|nr:radical SAM protein [Propionibacteriaceae bacterium]